MMDGPRGHAGRARAWVAAAPGPDPATVRVIVGTFNRSEATVYEVDRAELTRQQDANDSDAKTAEWAMRTGREVFRTTFLWAYGIGGEG